MLKTIIPAAALALLMLPSEVDAYGAVHRGYTHVGPNGIYHTGATAVAGPFGAGVARNTTALGYGGGVYRGGYGAGYGYGGGAAVGGYRYAPGYGGGAVGGYRYGYIR